MFNRSANVMNKEAEAKAFLARYDARLAEARSKLAKHQGEQVSIVRWNPKGPSYMHGGTFASSVVTEMGLARPAHQIGDKSPHSPALSLESLNLLDGDWLVVGTLSTSGDAVDAMKQAEQTPAFQQLGAIKGKRFGAVDGSPWTSTGGPQAALKVIDDVEQLLTKPERGPHRALIPISVDCQQKPASCGLLCLSTLASNGQCYSGRGSAFCPVSPLPVLGRASSRMSRAGTM